MLQLPSHRCPVWCRRFFGLQHRLVWWKGLVAWRKMDGRYWPHSLSWSKLAPELYPCCWTRPDSGCRGHVPKPLLQHQSLTWRLPRPILVFWRLRTLIWKVSLLIAVETRDSTLVFFILSPLSAPTNFGFVDSRGRGGGIFEFPGTPPVFMVPLFFILFSLIRRLGILSRGGCRVLRSLRIISASHRSLRLDFVQGSVSGSTPSEKLEIGLLHVGIWL